MNTSKLSIVIPVYNLEGWLDACFRSLLGQTDRSDRWEVVAVDDGSTDRSPEQLEDWARRLEGRMSVFHIPNGGVNPARRHGLAKASGDYVWFVDGDDVIHPQAVEAYLALFERHPDVQMWTHEFVTGTRISFPPLPEPLPVTVCRDDVSAVGQVCVGGGSSRPTTSATSRSRTTSWARTSSSRTPSSPAPGSSGRSAAPCTATSCARPRPPTCSRRGIWPT